ncbi:MAG: disulfide bond formation protein B [Gammaproteobacteria bacterium]|nr:disulfide bond formation protein B [Gammaproteobacteria bacterium]
MNQQNEESLESTQNYNWLIIFACWLIALVSTLGSLFFSNVMGFESCVLCWYQRIFMYPLVIIFLVGLFPLDQNVIRFSLPLAVIGWCFAVYHYLLYMGFIPEDLKPCGEGASCTEVNLEMFGFITIPMLSILSYSIIIILLTIFKYRVKP